MDKYPYRIEKAIEKDAKVGCKGCAVWFKDLDLMVARSEALDQAAHDITHVALALYKSLYTHAPATARHHKEALDAEIAKWVEARKEYPLP